MYITCEAWPDATLISFGTVDDEEFLKKAVPKREIFTRHRLPLNHGWANQGAEQLETLSF